MSSEGAASSEDCQQLLHQSGAGSRRASVSFHLEVKDEAGLGQEEAGGRSSRRRSSISAIPHIESIKKCSRNASGFWEPD